VARDATGNAALAAAIAEAGITHGERDRGVVRVAAESGPFEFASVGRSHISHWVGGSVPSGRGRTSSTRP
jgi:hypothetical protein